MSGWIKRLRKKLRNRRPALLLGSILFILLLSAVLTWNFENPADSYTAQDEQAQVVISPQTWKVIIQKKYLAGPTVVEQAEYSQSELDQFVATFANMKKIEENENTIVYEQMIEDLSPVLKENGYFAIDQQGVLHLYQGEGSDQNIIQTFFQLDIERLETTLPMEEYMQLRDGIPFSSLAEYNSILSTYSEFAISTDEDGHVEEH